MYRFSFIYLLSILFLFFSCSEEPDLNNVDPRELTVEVEVQDQSGLVKINTTALNTKYFELDPGDGSEKLTDSTGSFSYTYTSNGTYELIIRAYGSSGKFVQEKERIVIQLVDDQIQQYEGFSLVWQEEFEGSSLNEKNWNYEIGTGSNGWGNNELQYYRRENTQVTGGNLIITAKKENFGGRSYTSSRLTTQNKYSFQYGRVDIRAKLPEGQGIWPALWMLGSNFSSIGWPACGEIDIMEMIGGNGRENTVHGTLHWQDPNGNPGNNNHAESGQKFTSSSSFSDDYHLFSIIWNDREVMWMVDNKSFSRQGITDPNKSEFLKPFFFIVNVAVGGNWPGSPDASTLFPQKIMVDYIRVYEEN